MMTSVVKKLAIINLVFFSQLLFADTNDRPGPQQWFTTAHQLVDLGKCLESSLAKTKILTAREDFVSEDAKAVALQLEQKTADHLKQFDEVLGTIRGNPDLSFSYVTFKSKGLILFSTAQRIVLKMRTQDESPEILSLAQAVRNELKCFQNP